MKLPLISSWISPSAGPSSHLEKRKNHGSQKDSPDAPAAAIPSLNVGKDDPVSLAKPSVDVAKDLPTSDPKPGAAPSTITTTVTSTVSASDGASTVTTTIQHTDTKTVTVSAGISSTSEVVSGMPLSGAALTDALLAEKGKSSKSMLSIYSETNQGNSTLTSHPLPATLEMDRAVASALPVRPTVTSTVTYATTPTCSSVPVRKNQLSSATIVAIVFGLVILFLVATTVFLVRRFFRMYKAEEMLRRHAQIETNELKEMNGQNGMVGTTVIDRPSKGNWGFTRKESWEK